MKIIIAGDFRQATGFMKAHFNDGYLSAKYISNIFDLYGRHGQDLEIALVGEYVKNTAYLSGRFFALIDQGARVIEGGTGEDITNLFKNESNFPKHLNNK